MSGRPNRPEEIDEEDWEAIDSPEISDELFAKMQPVKGAAPELIELQEKCFAKRGRPKAENPKKLQSLRLSEEVIEHFKAKGTGWQTRINETLEKVVEREKRAQRRLTSPRDLPLSKPKSKRAR